MDLTFYLAIFLAFYFTFYLTYVLRHCIWDIFWHFVRFSGILSDIDFILTYLLALGHEGLIHLK